MVQQNPLRSDPDQNSLALTLSQQFACLLDERLDCAVRKHTDDLYCKLKALLQELSEGAIQASVFSDNSSTVPGSPVAADAGRGLDKNAPEAYSHGTREPRLSSSGVGSERNSPENARRPSEGGTEFQTAPLSPAAHKKIGRGLDENAPEAYSHGTREPRLSSFGVGSERNSPENARRPSEGGTEFQTAPLSPAAHKKIGRGLDENTPEAYRHGTRERRLSSFGVGFCSEHRTPEKARRGGETSSQGSAETQMSTTTAHRETRRQKTSFRQMTRVDVVSAPPVQYSQIRRAIWWTVNSWWFEIVVACVIATNSVFIGVQIEIAARSHGRPVPVSLFVLNLVYTLLFVIELVLRTAASGLKFFYKADNLGWHYLDVLIVVSSLLELALGGISGDVGMRTSESSVTNNMRLVRFVRITRILRIMRIVKVVRFIRALRSLIYSIIFTLRSLAWSMLLLMLIMYVFAIIFTDAVTQHLSSRFGEEHRKIELVLMKRFGTLHDAMHTLFRCIAEGISWDLVIEPLIDVNWLLGYAFSLYIAFCCFAVLNVMTGVFCQSAKESAEKDQDLMIQMHHMDKQRRAMTIKQLFQALDTRKSGSITLREFEEQFRDEDVKAFFHIFELEPVDAWTLFMLLDTEGTGDVDVEEFVEGCLKLKGPAKSIDLAVLMHDARLMKKRLHTIEVHNRQLQGQVAEVLSVCSKMSVQESKTPISRRLQL